MATFTPNVEVVTKSPTVTVDGGLRPGTYRFRLIVEDASDSTRSPTRSVPKLVTVVIRQIIG